MTRSTIRILLAAGDQAVACRLGHALEIAGYEVTIVTRGAEVIRWVTREAPDILVCETILCDIDALQLCRRLRRQSASFPVILLAEESTCTEVSGVDRVAASLPGSPLIPVPCDEQRLVDLVRDLVSDLQSTAPGFGGFPTRVIWPTARRRSALLAR